MKKILAFMTLLMLITLAVEAKNITVVTGYGYYKDADNHITSKAELPKGTHVLNDSLTYVEVADKEALDAVEVYVAPLPEPTQEELDEALIQKKIRSLAIDDLKKEGKLSANFKDPKDK